MTAQDQQEIDQLVRAAWANAKENGFAPDPDDREEALQLSTFDADIEKWVFRLGHSRTRRLDRLIATVRRLRSEAG